MTTLLAILRQPSAFTRLRRIRLLVIASVALIALLSSTIAIAQYSQDFDLACRSKLTAASGVITSANFGVIGALGMPMVPPQDSSTAPTYAVRSQDFGVRAGFLPVYATRQNALIADVEIPDQSPFIQHLPIVSRLTDFIRGGC